MSDAEWLRGIADSGWNNDEWPAEVKAMLRRVADRLEVRDADLARINNLQRLVDRFNEEIAMLRSAMLRRSLVESRKSPDAS